MASLSNKMRLGKFKLGDMVHLTRGAIVGVNEGEPCATVMGGTELIEEHVWLETPELVQLYNEAFKFEPAEARCKEAIRRISAGAITSVTRDPDIIGFVLGPLQPISEDAGIAYAHELLVAEILARESPVPPDEPAP